MKRHSVLPICQMIMALLLLAGCDKEEAPPLPPEAAEDAPIADIAALHNQSWLVKEIEGAGVIAELDAGVLFGTDGSVTGRAGCNYLSGQAELSGENLEIGTLITTKRACPPPVMAQEERFLAALGKVEKWRIEDGNLQLLDVNEQPLLQFAPAR